MADVSMVMWWPTPFIRRVKYNDPNGFSNSMLEKIETIQQRWDGFDTEGNMHQEWRDVPVDRATADVAKKWQIRQEI